MWNVANVFQPIEKLQRIRRNRVLWHGRCHATTIILRVFDLSQWIKKFPHVPRRRCRAVSDNLMVIEEFGCAEGGNMVEIFAFMGVIAIALACVDAWEPSSSRDIDFFGGTRVSGKD